MILMTLAVGLVFMLMQQRRSGKPITACTPTSPRNYQLLLMQIFLLKLEVNQYLATGEKV